MQRTDDMTSQVERDIQRAVATMLSLKLRSGSSPEELKRFVNVCLDRAINEHRPSPSGKMVGLYQIARVLRTWHLETRFLTTNGQPKPLKMKGKGGLRSLILCHFPARMVSLVLTTMKRNGLIRLKRSQ